MFLIILWIILSLVTFVVCLRSLYNRLEISQFLHEKNLDGNLEKLSQIRISQITNRVIISGIKLLVGILALLILIVNIKEVTMISGTVITVGFFINLISILIAEIYEQHLESKILK